MAKKFKYPALVIQEAYRLVGEYRPFSLDEIVQMMNKKSIEMPDHHGEKTNVR